MASITQILQGTTARPRVTFYSNGVPTDLDSGVPVVAGSRPDGTALAALTAAKVAATTGIYEITNLPAQPTPTVLEFDWTGIIGSQAQTITTHLEVIGAFLFSVAAFRAMRVAGGTPFALTAIPLISDTDIMDTRAAILDEMTQVLGFSPVPRFAREHLDSHGDNQLLLVDPGVEAHHPPLSVTINGAAQALSGYSLGADGILETASGYTFGGAFTSGRRNIVVEYVHGTARPPGNGSQVAMLWAAAQLNPSGFSSASTVSLPDGSSYTYEPSETGRGGWVRHTGIREVDRYLNRWARSVAV